MKKKLDSKCARNWRPSWLISKYHLYDLHACTGGPCCKGNCKGNEILDVVDVLKYLRNPESIDI